MRVMRVLLVCICMYTQGFCCGSLVLTVDVDERSPAGPRRDSVAAAFACEISSRRQLPYFRAANATTRVFSPPSIFNGSNETDFIEFYHLEKCSFMLLYLRFFENVVRNSGNVKFPINSSDYLLR